MPEGERRGAAHICICILSLWQVTSAKLWDWDLHRLRWTTYAYVKDANYTGLQRVLYLFTCACLRSNRKFFLL